MIKVIIADDEENVCQLIQNLIDWNSLGMEIIGIAHNGIETLDMIRTLSPDLVITDIRMPGYDGLEMIRRAKDIKEELNFIIISGYGHFEYAQNAIKYGVGDYLLKPIKQEDLLSALEKIKAKYARNLKQLSEEERMRRQIENDADKLREGIFSERLLKKGATTKDLTIDSANDYYHYSFQSGIFQVIGVKIDCGYDDQYNSAIPILEEKITRIIDNLLRTQCFEIGNYMDDSTVYCILNYDIERKKSIRAQIKGILDELIQQKAAFEQFEFTIAIGEVYDDISGLKDSFNSAVYAIGQRLLLGTGRVIEGAIMNQSLQLQARLMAELNKSMGPAIEVLNSDAVLSSLKDFYNTIAAEKRLSGLDIISLAEQACEMYLTHLRNNQIAIHHGDEFLEKFHIHAWRCKTVDEIFSYLCMMIGESIKLIAQQKEQEETRPIRLAKQYIQENYMKPISLEDISNIVGFSPTYFSTLFKKVSGTNFVDYLTETRVNKAKELLRETNLNIAEICEQVGYSDLKHFTKSFRKNTGLKPSEYRKLYS